MRSALPPPLYESRQMFVYEFEMPIDLCKTLIGEKAANIREINEKTGASISPLKYQGGPTNKWAIQGMLPVFLSL